MIYKYTAEGLGASLNQKYYCSLEVYPRKRKIKIKTIILFSSIIANIVFIILRFYDVNAINMNKTDKSIIANDEYKNQYHSDHLKLSFMYKYSMAAEYGKSAIKEMGSQAGVQNVYKAANQDNKSLKKDEKVAYLTFDDGPTYKITPQVLKILDGFDIKATFFVLGEMCSLNPGILRDVQAAGHLISNHTYSHDYDKIYKSPNTFISELVKCEETIASVLGNQWNANKIIRFPGGSFDKKLAPIKEEIKKKGYISYDWNALNGDAEGIKVPAKKLVNNIVKSIEGKDSIIVLMHDSSGKETTVESLPQIISILKEKGFVFKTLDQYDK
ncbi:MAG TPA: polysaccharide deacetylase family protein [Pseudobacteroides sp.]|uniref:polysaccharide deacetylase family protein n=1 Tax=Pseudobacteroides sp. TaxID=1968840 RepID=UPI002F93FEF6